jgi:hypothetical protein
MYRLQISKHDNHHSEVIGFGDFNGRAKTAKWASNLALPRPVYTSVIAHKLFTSGLYI